MGVSFLGKYEKKNTPPFKISFPYGGISLENILLILLIWDKFIWVSFVLTKFWIKGLGKTSSLSAVSLKFHQTSFNFCYKPLSVGQTFSSAPEKQSATPSQILVWCRQVPPQYKPRAEHGLTGILVPFSKSSSERSIIRTAIRIWILGYANWEIITLTYMFSGLF